MPYTIFEDFKETSIETIKMLFSAIIILVILLVGTNAAWLRTWKIVMSARYKFLSIFVMKSWNIQNCSNCTET